MLANVMYGEPVFAKPELAETIKQEFIEKRANAVTIKGVKPFLQLSARGIEFVRLATQFGYHRANTYQLYRRYVNWYLRQGALDANEKALRDSGNSNDQKQTPR